MPPKTTNSNDRSKPFGTVLGLAGGVGGFAKPEHWHFITKAGVRELEQSGAGMPYSFTGRWKGNLYYKGTLWTGPSNAMGRR